MYYRHHCHHWRCASRVPILMIHLFNACNKLIFFCSVLSHKRIFLRLPFLHIWTFFFFVFWFMTPSSVRKKHVKTKVRCTLLFISCVSWSSVTGPGLIFIHEHIHLQTFFHFLLLSCVCVLRQRENEKFYHRFIILTFSFKIYCPINRLHVRV